MTRVTHNLLEMKVENPRVFTEAACKANVLFVLYFLNFKVVVLQLTLTLRIAINLFCGFNNFTTMFYGVFLF